ncbi:hypothetical protein [Metabacillus fastidiosus]|uniref:hypothetical protein n=1 Tax=Metabacillus fastidiosus TaxID=1458 RepID=UPI003D2E6182
MEIYVLIILYIEGLWLPPTDIHLPLTHWAMSFPFLEAGVFCRKTIKKKNITVHYTPFDEITGHSPVRFHEEQEIIVEDEKCCNDKDKKIAKRNQK